MRLVHTAVSIIYVFLIIAGVLLAMSKCSSNSCARKASSVDEARRALGAFFSSNAAASARLIAELREEGLVDDVLIRLRQGCQGCYIALGKDGEDPTSWYLFLSIAPLEAKRHVVLEIECENSVRLAYTAHGG